MKRPVFCTSCGSENQWGARFCSSCGASMIGLGTVIVGQLHPPQPVNKGRWTQAKIAGLVISVALILAIVLMGIPLPHGFSATLISSPFGASFTQLGATDAAEISGNWYVQGGGHSLVEIEDKNGGVVYRVNATSGSFSFGGGPYDIAAVGSFATVIVNGTSWVPIVNVGLP